VFVVGGHWNDDRDCESAARLRISVTNPSLRSRCACDHLVDAREESYKLVQNPDRWLPKKCRAVNKGCAYQAAGGQVSSLTRRLLAGQKRTFVIAITSRAL